MNIGGQWSVGARLGAVCLAAAGSSVAPPVQAAPDGVNEVSITSINLYAGTTSTGALVFFSPAKPGMGGCSNATGNAVWVDWSSQVQPDGKALLTVLYANYLAGKTVGFSTNGCTSDTAYPVVYAITL
jgi:hypothetical protein